MVPALPLAKPRMTRLPDAMESALVRRGSMSWSLNIGTIAGTAVRIHITFLLFLGWIFFASYVAGGPEAAMDERSSSWCCCSRACWRTNSATSSPRAPSASRPRRDAAADRRCRAARAHPEEPREEFLIAIAGPLVNVVIAFGLALIAGRPSRAATSRRRDSANVSLVDRLAAVNLFLALFNMIPAFPMDGGRVLRALLATRLGYARRPRSPPRSGRPSPSRSASSGCSTIRC